MNGSTRTPGAASTPATAGSPATAAEITTSSPALCPSSRAAMFTTEPK